MELIYFISGILVAGATYATVLLRKNQSLYHDALARLQSHQNISSIREGEFKEKLNDLLEWSHDIQNKLEKDQYESISELNKQLNGMRADMETLEERIGFISTSNEKNFGTLFSEMGQVKNTVKVMSQDPNFTRTF